MRRSLFIQLVVFLGCATFFFYEDIEEQNRIAALKMELPKVSQNLKNVREELTRLRYEIEQFESPANLLHLAEASEYRHLKQPFAKDIVAITEKENSPGELVASASPSKKIRAPVPLATHSSFEHK